MKIELDHQELQTVLEHVRQTKSADTAILKSLVQTVAPQVMTHLFESRPKPTIVPDAPKTDEPEATGTDD